MLQKVWKKLFNGFQMVTPKFALEHLFSVQGTLELNRLYQTEMNS